MSKIISLKINDKYDLIVFIEKNTDDKERYSDIK